MAEILMLFISIFAYTYIQHRRERREEKAERRRQGKHRPFMDVERRHYHRRIT